MTAKKVKCPLSHWLKPVYGLIVISFLLSACSGKQPAQPVENNSPVPQQSPTVTAIPSLTPTPQPSALTVCTAKEPASLYRYDGSNSESKKTIFSALYGQGIMKFDELSVLLERLPSRENGDIQVLPLEVMDGDMILDAHGELTVLKQGVEVIPIGCVSKDCVIAWDGESALILPALQISYQLKKGLQWSDSEPLTADDVLFSYQIASDKATPTDKQILDLTDSVSVEKEVIFIWNGLAGLGNQNPEHSFWLPLPRHQFEVLTAAELVENEIAAREPLSWGAYRLVGWEKSEPLQFEANPFFKPANLAAKPFDSLTIKIITDQKAALEAFNGGQCDILDSSYGLESLPAAELPGKLHVLTPFEVSALVFGVNPASYDDGHVAGEDERADYFGDIRTRQAVALCIDPVGLSGLLSAERLGVSDFSLLVDEPSLPESDPNTLLDEAGWIDDDANPTTARVSKGVENVEDLTPFEINLYSGLGDLDMQAAAEISKRLEVCGIKIANSSLPAIQLYAPGPEGVLFGRQFDLVIINWAGYIGASGDCMRYLSSQIPAVENNWVGTNLAGLNDLSYDVACLSPQGSEANADVYNRIVSLDLVPRYKAWISQVDLNLEN